MLTGELRNQIDTYLLFLKRLDGDGSTYAHHMRDSRFTIPTPNLLGRPST